MRIIALFLVLLVTALPGRAHQTAPPAKPQADWAEQQIEAILEDRPQLQPLVEKDSKVWDWLKAAFAYPAEGTRIKWDSNSTPPSYPNQAQSSGGPDENGILGVQVDRFYKFGPYRGDPLSGEYVLAGLVFELNNVRSYVKKVAIHNRARDGGYDRDSFIRDCAECEYETGQKTAEFYQTIWLPYCEAKKRTPDPYDWQCPYPDTFEKWLAKYPRDHWYPWKYFARSYDVLTEGGQADAKFWAGDYAAAIEHYSNLLKLWTEPAYYYRRGVAKLILGQSDGALDDMRSAELNTPIADSNRDYSYLVAWVILQREGKAAEANSQLRFNYAYRLESPKDWMSAVAAFLLGKTSETTFLSFADHSEAPSHQARSSDVFYFAGIKRSLAGDQAIATDDFRQSAQLKGSYSLIRALAEAELKNESGKSASTPKADAASKSGSS